MKIKVCGMRDTENISELVKLKPDYIGFIFYGKSKRFVAKFPKIEIPSKIKKVGVFVNENIDEVIEIVEKNKLDAIQLHGSETPEYCKDLRNCLTKPSRSEVTERSRSDNSGEVISTPLNHPFEIFKAFSVDDNFNFEKTKVYEKACNYFLFDTKGKDYGGNGVKFNWQILDNYKGETPFLLSGGISKVDAAEIKNVSHKAFAGVDINSGFEIEPGLKNIANIKEFKQNLL